MLENSMKDSDDVKFQDRLTIGFMAVVLLAAVAAIIGSGKKEVVTNDIEVLDVEEILIIDQGPLPEIEIEAEVLPEILPPLFEEALPPLQGEV